MAEVFAAIGLVLAAGISAMASILVAKLRGENTSQHAANLERLGRNADRLENIAEDVAEIKTSVHDQREAHDRHIEWHVRGDKP